MPPGHGRNKSKSHDITIANENTNIINPESKIKTRTCDMTSFNVRMCKIQERGFDYYSYTTPMLVNPAFSITMPVRDTLDSTRFSKFNGTHPRR